MAEVTYNINDVTGRLSAKIANLEVQLAHEQAAKEAYHNRVKELEDKLNEKEDKPNEARDSKKK